MRLRLIGFSGMLIITMALSVISFFALLVSASAIQDEFSISKLQIGLMAGINTGVGGLIAPFGGRVVDVIGGRKAMAAVLVLSGTTMVFIALAQSYEMLLVSMALAGIPQGMGNPSTNRAIAHGIKPAQRGVLTGVKQSGVQFAVFVSGFTMPWFAATYDWRTGILIMAGLAFSVVPGVALITELPVDASSEATRNKGEASPRLPTFVNQVAIYGFLLGSIGGGIGGFLPLFAEEAAGLSAATAGRVFGLQGLIAIPTRILSGIVLDRGVSARRMLVSMAIGGSVAILLILSASSGMTAFLWIGAILGGMTLGAWNTAANLSMIRQGGNAGRASGRLILGFLLGTTIGGPTVGWSIDAFDSYRPAWIASAVIALIAATIVSGRLGDRARAS
ncbi:MAG: MFS transporter [Acidimicrobiia bacterium]|nr:MFS transporter [Acidimicrobiia bacterium]